MVTRRIFNTRLLIYLFPVSLFSTSCLFTFLLFTYYLLIYLHLTAKPPFPASDAGILFERQWQNHAVGLW